MMTTDFDSSTPLETIVDFIDASREQPRSGGAELLPLLSEAHPLYADRAGNEVAKLRAYAMAALEHTGLPPGAVPFVRESLESSMVPYTVAAAACALRGTSRPAPGIIQLLVGAIFNIWRADRPVTFSAYHVEWPQPEGSHGLTEIFRTLAHFGADACGALPTLRDLSARPDKFSEVVFEQLLECITAVRGQGRDRPTRLESARSSLEWEPLDRPTERDWPPRGLALEDQHARRLRWLDFFCEKPTVVGFFYTRCGNPYKCTRTISNLSWIQDEVERRGLGGQVRVSAISYDAQFDTPDALKSYGDARNFRFGEDYRMFRVSEGFERLVEQMRLEVSFSGTQVTSHRIEIFVLDRAGEVTRSFVRLQSEPEAVVDTLEALI